MIQQHVLDVTFTEDVSRIRQGNGPEISSVFRRPALNILQQDTTVKASIRGKRKLCGSSESAFERLIAVIVGINARLPCVGPLRERLSKSPAYVLNY